MRKYRRRCEVSWRRAGRAVLISFEVIHVGIVIAVFSDKIGMSGFVVGLKDSVREACNGRFEQSVDSHSGRL